MLTLDASGMIVLASARWMPSSNPVGWPSVVAAVVVVGLGAGVALCRYSRWVALPAMLIPALLSNMQNGSLTGWVFRSRRAFWYPDAADFLASIIYIAFGFVLSVAVIRRTAGWARWIGHLFAFLYASLLVSQALFETDLLCDSYRLTYGQTLALGPVICGLIWAPCLVYWLVACAVRDT